MPLERVLSNFPIVQSRPKFPSTRTSIPQGLSNTLSETLHSLLPSEDECRRICSSTKFLPCFFQQMLTRNWKRMSASRDVPILTPNRVAKLPSPDVHPILLAQKMLMLACLAQFISKELSDEEWKGRAEHMAAAAIEVAAKEELCRNAEGLECLMLEATFHAGNGDIRRAFSAVRRAMVCGQLLGIHRSHDLDIIQIDRSAPPFDPAYMWYRVISVDRLFSLVLGLPQGYSSVRFTSVSALPSLDPEEQLERQHNEIASWILDRNERDIDDLVTTQSIDQSLQNAGSLLPPAWWLPPALSTVNSRRDMFLSTTRLVSQLLHFNLVNQTHLPYIHRSGPLYGYNKAASATASREVLHRYLILQDSSFVAHTGYIVGFFSWIAAMTLVLAHLECHWQDDSPELSAIAHMRSSDRAMVERTINYFAKYKTCEGREVLEHLLQVEEEAFLNRSVGSGTIMKGLPDEGPFFELKIPYLGQLRLNSAKICFLREAHIEELSFSVKSRKDCEEAEALPLFDDFDPNAFVGGGESIWV